MYETKIQYYFIARTKNKQNKAMIRKKKKPKIDVEYIKGN